MLTLLARVGPRLLKELIFAVVVALLAEPAIEAFRDAYHDWARDLKEEDVTQNDPIQGPQVASTVAPPLPLPPAAAPPEPPVEKLAKGPRQLEDKAILYTHHCSIPDRGETTFEVVVFSDSYNWVYGSDREIQGVGGEEEFIRILQRPAYQEFMSRSREIMVAGTASCEGDDETLEDHRALQRALNMKRWLEGYRALPDRESLDLPVKSMHVLNLGRYCEDCEARLPCARSRSGDTTSQRKVILIGVVDGASALQAEDFRWCAENSMKGDRWLAPVMKHYCRYDVNIGLNGEKL